MLVERGTDAITRAIQYLDDRDRDESSLSESDRDFLDRMSTMRSLVQRHGHQRGRRIYQATFKVSETTSYRDHAKMELIFGSLRGSNRALRLELTLLELDRLKEKAEEQGDLKTAVLVAKTIFEWSQKEQEKPPFDPTEIQSPVKIIRELPDKFKNADLPKGVEAMDEWMKRMHAPKNIDDAKEIGYDEHPSGSSGDASE